MTKFVFYGMVFQVEQDIPIWNNKTYQHQPCVVKNDGKKKEKKQKKKKRKGRNKEMKQGKKKLVFFQVEQDIPIWDNKTYQHQPCVVKNDGKD